MEFSVLLKRGVVFCLFLAGVAFASAGYESGETGRERARAKVGEPVEGRMRDALEILIRTEAGRAVIDRAQRYWKAETPERILEHLRWGEASKTDAVITRYYNTATGEERRERQVVVFLKVQQRLEDLVLDIAHELVHATLRPAWDPYDPELTPARYIFNAIEGQGGEADAVEAECRVSLEMRARFGTTSLRCEEYATGSGALDRKRILSDFYRVGRWRAELDRRFGTELRRLPLLSAQAPKLFSSTGQTPYPVALTREYDEITDIACRNARKRRAIASQSGVAAAGIARSDQSEFLRARCGES